MFPHHHGSVHYQMCCPNQWKEMRVSPQSHHRGTILKWIILEFMRFISGPCIRINLHVRRFRETPISKYVPFWGIYCYVNHCLCCLHLVHERGTAQIRWWNCRQPLNCLDRQTCGSHSCYVIESLGVFHPSFD